MKIEPLVMPWAILTPFLILQPQSALLEDLQNIESSLNSCKKKKKWFIVLTVMRLVIIVQHATTHYRDYLTKLYDVTLTLY